MISVLPLIVSVFPSYRAVLGRYLRDFPAGGLFVPGPCELATGQRVVVHVTFAQPPLGLQTAGLIRWKRVRGSRDLPAGIGVEFSGEGRPLGPILLSLADGADLKLAPRARRFTVEMPARLQLQGAAVVARLRDISTSGAFIETSSAIPLGAQPSLLLAPPNNPPLTLLTDVVRTAPAGIGVRFIWNASHASGDLRAWCRTIEQRATAAVASE